MDNSTYFTEHFNNLQKSSNGSLLSGIRQQAFNQYNKLGLPVKHEEWKYTRISGALNKQFATPGCADFTLTEAELNDCRLPGWEQANELVFINGIFSKEFSTIRSPQLTVMPLEDAEKNGHQAVVESTLGHSGSYLRDGVNALNTAFVNGGAFIHVKRGSIVSQPVYIYNITDARQVNILAQPRTLVHVEKNANVQLVETYKTFGKQESFTNQVMEVMVEQDARLEYYKIQNDAAHANQVSTTHVRQTGKSYVHTVTISLGGNIVRNNQNLVLEAEYCEAHLYGLYFLSGNTHVDNHTIVDNVEPHCFSNELYKGIMDGSSTGVFNGKIYVQRKAQKTNAYQSNKNILLSDDASVNTKPQLEIFADDVKCSHGCTIGKLDEEGMFYLRSRGITEDMARSLLLQAFSLDVLEHIKPEPIRAYIDQLISERLQFDAI